MDEDNLVNKKKTRHNDELRKFGKHLESLILEKGYASAYDFWIQRAGDEMARAGLNYIIAGKREPKLLTLILLADLLEVTTAELLDF